MSLSVDSNGWQVRQNVGGSPLSQLVADKFGGDRLGDELSQDYEFSGPFMGEPNMTANLQINCRIEKGVYGLSVNTMLFFYFRPFHLTEENFLIMRLHTEDRTRGGQVPVIARPFGGFQEKGSDWVVFAVMGSSEETRKCVSALTSGQQLYFMLFKEKQFADDAERKSFEEFCDGVGYFVFDQLVKLPLPPDGAFKEVYNESYQRIAGAEDASTKVSLSDRLDKLPASGKSTVLAQLPEVEAVLGRFIVDFHDRTRLHYVLIFPVVHKIAVKLFVEDFGVQSALKHYEQLVASLTSGGTIRESQFKSFGWPEAPPHEAPHTIDLDAQLWKLARDLIARGILKETIASALVNTALRGALGIDPAFLSVGYFITVLKELRAGVYTPAPEVRPEVAEGTDEATTQMFKSLRDLAYTFKEGSGLEWQHLLPAMQRVCVICTMKYRGQERTLELFRDQVKQLDPFLDQCQRNPPQAHSITPLHVHHMATFDEKYLEVADSFLKIPGVHPVMIAHALSMLVTKLASAHYDVVFLSAILASSCTDIEQGKYDFVRETTVRSQSGRSAVKLEDSIETREGNSQSEAGAEAMPHDRKYLELARTFAIVIITLNDDDPVRDVWLMQLDEKGEIDFDHEEFVLAQTTTRDAALNYAMKLSNLLKLRVLEIAKT